MIRRALERPPGVLRFQDECKNRPIVQINGQDCFLPTPLVRQARFGLVFGWPVLLFLFVFIYLFKKKKIGLGLLKSGRVMDNRFMW